MCFNQVIEQSIQEGNYIKFNHAFSQLKQLAFYNQEAKNMIYDLHEKMTRGAARRIFQSQELSLEYINVSEMNFYLYLANYQSSAF